MESKKAELIKVESRMVEEGNGEMWSKSESVSYVSIAIMINNTVFPYLKTANRVHFKYSHHKKEIIN